MVAYIVNYLDRMQGIIEVKSGDYFSSGCVCCFLGGQVMGQACFSQPPGVRGINVNVQDPPWVEVGMGVPGESPLICIRTPVGWRTWEKSESESGKHSQAWLLSFFEMRSEVN